MKRDMKHEKKYVGNANGGGKIVCSCGNYETPIVNDGDNFTLGIKGKTVEQYFAEHLVESAAATENAMVDTKVEQAVAPAQHSQSRGRRR